MGHLPRTDDFRGSAGVPPAPGFFVHVRRKPYQVQVQLHLVLLYENIVAYGTTAFLAGNAPAGLARTVHRLAGRGPASGKNVFVPKPPGR